MCMLCRVVSGYVSRDNHSWCSIVWLEWMASQSGTNIHHALHHTGEYRIPGTNYRVDGFCAQTNTVYEFLGKSCVT